MSRGDLPTDHQPSHRVHQSFSSAKARENWFRRAYRQMVKTDNWEDAPLVDAQTQAALEAMPEQADGHYFMDPHGRYRVLGQAQREDPNVMRHRLDSVSAWLDNLPRKNETGYADLANLKANYPHPGEDEQVKKWEREAPLFDPTVDYLGIGKSAPEKETIQLAKGPINYKAIIADVPFDQAPSRITMERTQTPVFNRGGYATTQPRDKIAPVMLQDTDKKSPLGKVVHTVFGSQKEMVPPANFAAPAPQPFSSAPSILRTDRPFLALGLQPEELQSMRWESLASRLKERDNYDPRDFSIQFKQLGARQFGRRGTRPEVAAQDAIDAAHELNLAKGRDWGTDLPRNNPGAIMSEYEHAVETLVKEAGDFWTERVRRVPIAAEVEMMRAYIEPRIVNYFPTETQDIIRSHIAPPKIQSGSQGAQELVTALAFGEIQDITINGRELDFPAAAQTDVDAHQARRYGPQGGLTAQRLNYLIGQEVKKMLEACKEVSRAEIVGGPKKATPDGPKPYDRVKEYMLQDPRRRGLQGSVKTDVSIRLWYQGQDCVFHINTVDMLNDVSMSKREAEAFERALLNAVAMFQMSRNTKDRWKLRDREGRLSERNVVSAAPKADSSDEEAVQRVLEDFLSHLSCAKIIAKCKKGYGTINSMPKKKQRWQ